MNLLARASGRELAIQTSEGIQFSQPIASPAVRMLAMLVDYSIIIGALELLQIPLTLLNLVSIDVAQAIVLVTSFLFSIGYGIYFEWRHRGQTVGKRVLRLRVVHQAGLKLEFSQIVMRNLLRVVDQLPLLFLVGGIAALVDRKGRRLGDVAAGTVVVRIPATRKPVFDEATSEKYNSLRNRMGLVARLRQEVSPELADIALAAVSRRTRLNPDARLALFEDLASEFKALVRLPEDVLHGVSDERLVLNIVEVIFQAAPKG